MASDIYLIRHCQAGGQAPDAALTAAGRTQAQRLGDALATAGITRIVASPFRRAWDSAAPLASRLGLDILVDDRLAERVLTTEPAEDWRDRLRRSFADPALSWPGGESGATATQRGRAALDAATTDADGAVAVVTHGNLLALILHSLDRRDGFDTWAGLTNPDVFRIDGTGQIHRQWTDEA